MDYPIQARSADPLPLLISGGNVKPDGSLRFSEKAAKSGSLGAILGRDIMPLILTFTNRARFGGSRLGPEDLPYHLPW